MPLLAEILSIAFDYFHYSNKRKQKQGEESHIKKELTRIE